MEKESEKQKTSKTSRKLPEKKIGLLHEEEKTDYYQPEHQESPKENIFKKILKGAGTGGLVIGGGILFTIFHILQFLFTAIAGLGMIWLAITFFSDGSIIIGLLVLLIGTPLAIWFAQFAFIFLLPLAILSAIIWGIATLFGFSVSFFNVWDFIWLIIKILILGFMVFLGISGLVEAIKTKQVAKFFKDNWFYILIFLFLLWLFF